jgi:hypothetical protein
MRQVGFHTADIFVLSMGITIHCRQGETVIENLLFQLTDCMVPESEAIRPVRAEQNY